MRVASLLFALFLAGCAAVPPAPVVAPQAEALWHARQEQLAQLSDWSLEGRVAVTAGDEGWNANLLWSQQSQQYRIRILAPLGQNAAWLEGDAEGVTLRTADRRTVRAADPEALLHAELGWSIPLSGMRHWVLGLPDPGEPAVPQLDATGRLAALDQDGWHIEFLRYRDAGTWNLPDKIFLERQQFKVRLVIDQWSLVGPVQPKNPKSNAHRP
jgi:outer membrane lipoprotein LolB